MSIIFFSIGFCILAISYLLDSISKVQEQELRKKEFRLKVINTVSSLRQVSLKNYDITKDLIDGESSDVIREKYQIQVPQTPPINQEKVTA